MPAACNTASPGAPGPLAVGRTIIKGRGVGSRLDTLIGLGGRRHMEFRYYFVDKVGGRGILDPPRSLAHIQARMFINGRP